MEAPGVDQGSRPIPYSAAEIAKRNRLKELGIDKVLNVNTKHKALGILKVNLDKTSERLKQQKDLKSRVLTSIDPSNKKPSEEQSFRGKLIQDSINYLQLFCLYNAQKFEKQNILKDGGDIDPDVNLAIDLLESVSELHKEGKLVDLDTINVISIIVTEIFEKYSVSKKERRMVGSPVFQSLIRLSKIISPEEK